jgi:asparagine synthase (glutamine-hydrolysing)
MTLSLSTFRDAIPAFVHHMDEPVSDGAAIPLYFVSELASRCVKVILGGDGSDELFAGYSIYSKMLLMEQYRRLPTHLRNTLLIPLMRRFAQPSKMSKYLHLSTLPLERRYLNVHLYDIRLREGLYHEEFRRKLNGYDPLDSLQEIYRQTKGWDTLNRLLYLDLKTWLPDEILIKSDRMSMAASVELREPFLDYRIVELAARMPTRFKLQRGQTKYVLKQALAPVLPRAILKRKKMGFPSPVGLLFREEMHDYVRELLFNRKALWRGYFDGAVLGHLVERHLRGQADFQTALWRLIILEQWHQLFVDRRFCACTPFARQGNHHGTLNLGKTALDLNQA